MSVGLNRPCKSCRVMKIPGVPSPRFWIDEDRKKDLRLTWGRGNVQTERWEHVCPTSCDVTNNGTHVTAAYVDAVFPIMHRDITGSNNSNRNLSLPHCHPWKINKKNLPVTLILTCKVGCCQGDNLFVCNIIFLSSTFYYSDVMECSIYLHLPLQPLDGNAPNSYFFLFFFS